MPRLTDETLMAFVDGELSAEEHQAVADLLASSPDDARRLEIFNVTSRGALAKSFDGEPQDPVPTSLLEVIDRFKTVSSPDSPAAVEAAAKSVRPASSRYSVFPQSLAAIGLSLVIGGLLGWNAHDWQSGPTISQPATPFLASGVLHHVLESKQSGQKQALTSSQDRSAVQVRLSFATDTGTYCRQYQADLPNSEGYTGVACRLIDGRWQIRLHVPAKTKSNSGEKYTVASQSGGNASDELVGRLMTGDVLTVKQEQELIGRSWKPSN